MERLIPQQLGESLQSALADRGVQWALQDSIARIEPRSESSAVLHLNSGKQIEADLVLSAVGLKPNVSLAERAGLEVGRGIKVNQFGQTSDENIYSLAVTKLVAIGVIHTKVKNTEGRPTKDKRQ